LRQVMSGELGPRPATPDPTNTVALTSARLRYRRVLQVGAVFTMLYALIVLVLAARAGSLGFVSVLGGPVVSVDPGGPASRAGLLPGDRIVGINGQATPHAWDREHGLRWLTAGSLISLQVARGAEIHDVTYELPRKLPLASAAGAALAAAMMLLAMIAYRDEEGPPRTFFRSSVVYAFFLAGTFAWESVIRLPLLALPWMYSLSLAAPVTCHFMLQFPAGRLRLARSTLLLLYVPPFAIATWQVGLVLAFRLHLFDNPEHIVMIGTRATLVMAATYLTVGAVARARPR
jgi:hypothetical protein